MRAAQGPAKPQEEDMVLETSASRPVLSDAAAAQAVDGATAEARAAGVPVTIVVVDDGGNIKAMRRMDGAHGVGPDRAEQGVRGGGDRDAGR
jgi:uncharacterized protein GlcG (DUF336 family)